jgi:hypothetical protein
VVKIKNINVAKLKNICPNSYIGLEHRPYESSFSKAVLSSGVIPQIPFFVSFLLSAK